MGRFNVSALPGGFHNSTAIPGAIDLYEPVLYPRLMATIVVSSSTTVAQEEEKKKTKKKTKKYTETPSHTSIGSEEEKKKYTPTPPHTSIGSEEQKKNRQTPHTSLAAPPIVLPTNPMTNLMDKTVDRTYTVTYVKPVFMIHVGGTRCVTWSIDRIVQRHACITWGVEFIRAIFFIFFLYV